MKQRILDVLAVIAGIQPNRVAVYAGVAVSIAAGLVPILADADLESTAGIAVAVYGVVRLLAKYLDGWQIYEAQRTRALLEMELELRAGSRKR